MTPSRMIMMNHSLRMEITYYTDLLIFQGKPLVISLQSVRSVKSAVPYQRVSNIRYVFKILKNDI